MEDYDLPESKFGRIFKVAGPCKWEAEISEPESELFLTYVDSLTLI